MRRLAPVSAALVALIAAVLAPLGTASAEAAATPARLTVRPVAPKIADVCWSPFVPASGTVSLYQLSWDQGATVTATLDPQKTSPVNGRYCLRLDLMSTMVSYRFNLAATVGGKSVTAATPLRTTGYLLTGIPTPATTTAGRTVTIRGALTSQGAAVAGAKVRVQRKALPSGRWATVATVQTRANGSYRVGLKPTRSVVYRSYFKGVRGTPTVGSWDGVNRVNVRPNVKLTFSSNPASVGRPVTVRGRIVVGNVALLANDDACLQVRRGGSWRNRECPGISANGRMRVVLSPTSRADLRLRWRVFNVGPEYVPGSSRSRTLVVR